METDSLYGDRLLTYAVFFNLLAKSFVPNRDKMIENLRILAEISQHLPQKEIRERVLETLHSFEKDPDSTSEYFRLFELGISPPYETFYTTSMKKEAAVFEKADVAGFYRAFGVKCSGEFPDHIAAELEFLSLLLLKEAHALKNNDEEKAKICRDARNSFFEEHLGSWAHLFSQSIEKNAKKPTYIFWSRLLVEALKLLS